MSGGVLFVTRMFSGFFESFASGVWRPTGIPAVAKLLEQISARHRVYWLVTCKSLEESAVVGHVAKSFDLAGVRIEVLPWRHLVRSTRLNVAWNNYLAAQRALALADELRPEVAWCDRANVTVGARIASGPGIPTILRVLGVYPDQKRLATKLSSRFFSLFTWAAYRAPFALCVCSQDGSGVEYYLDRLLAPSTPRITLLNGTDKEVFCGRTATPFEDGWLHVLHVGKLTEDKGVPELIDAASLLHRRGARVRIVLAGKGPLEGVIKGRIEAEGLEKTIQLAGSVPSARIHEFYRQADVVISLNRLGNLSNVVLEAMVAGKCLLMLSCDPDTHTDEFTQKVVPQDVAIRIARFGTADDLARKLAWLAEQRDMVEDFAARMRSFAKKNLWSWQDRIGCEVEFIEALRQDRDIRPLLAKWQMRSGDKLS